ncbi:hypothetical protein [Bacillus thuringiensis]|uniref:hypothetical protein n=1 Tax=Bacillus thuringiensis TaxID=1428 RepID=UPI000BFB82D9|nr:hypothetical protein [Bacillus thuringiensis]PGP40995.1 hypothetical protein COA06_26350 [Bacillus thuringiensis]
MKRFVLKFLIFLIPLIIFSCVNFNYSNIGNMKDILLGAIALGSSCLGFFIAGVSIMQTTNFSRFYKKLVELGTNKKITAWLMAAIGYFFLLAFLSLFLLFFTNVENMFVQILFNIWLSTLTAAFISSLFVTIIIIIVFSK